MRVMKPHEHFFTIPEPEEYNLMDVDESVDLSCSEIKWVKDSNRGPFLDKEQTSPLIMIISDYLLILLRFQTGAIFSHEYG